MAHPVGPDANGGTSEDADDHEREEDHVAILLPRRDIAGECGCVGSRASHVGEKAAV